MCQTELDFEERHMGIRYKNMFSMIKQWEPKT